MPVDLSVFGRQKTIVDQRQLQAAFEFKKAAAAAAMQQTAQGGNLPAPLQMANEYQKRMRMGDTEGANLIMQFAKTQGKGLQVFDDGSFGQIPGYAPAVAGIAGATAGAQQQAKGNVDLTMKPQIAKEVEIAKKAGTAISDNQSAMAERMAQIPELETTVAELTSLGEKATYTAPGRVIDSLRTDIGLGPRESAVARTDYMAKVNNQVLPLLRQTFGAAFTQAEGEKLSTTLGNPDLSPKEKEVALRSFINQKYSDIRALKRQGEYLAGEPMTTAQPSNEIPPGAQLLGTSGGKPVYKLPDGSTIMEQ